MNNIEALNIILDHLMNVLKGRESPNKRIIDQTINIFEEILRPEIGSEIGKIASRIIEKYGHRLVQDLNLFGSIYDIAAYLKWKTLADLNTTALEIYHHTIIPTTKIMDQLFYADTKIKNPKNLAFVPAAPLFPRNFSNANQTAAWGFIDSYIESNERRSKLTVFIPKKNFLENESENVVKEIEFVKCESYADLVNQIKGYQCDALIQDYFMWSQVLLSYNLIDIPSIYLDPGFLPFFISPVKRIVSLPAQKTFVSQFQKNREKISFINRPYSNEKNLVDVSLRKFFDKDNVVFGSLGRGEKLQIEYIEFVAGILREIKNAKFIWAGKRSKEKLKDFPADIRERIELHDPIKAGDFLKDIDVFLETFPENQGYAVLDALHMDCVIISFDPKNSNANKSERLDRSIFRKSVEALDFVKAIIADNKFREDILIEQRKLINGFPKKGEYWNNFLDTLTF